MYSVSVEGATKTASATARWLSRVPRASAASSATVHARSRASGVRSARGLALTCPFGGTARIPFCECGGITVDGHGEVSGFLGRACAVAGILAPGDREKSMPIWRRCYALSASPAPRSSSYPTLAQSAIHGSAEPAELTPRLATRKDQATFRESSEMWHFEESGMFASRFPREHLDRCAGHARRGCRCRCASETCRSKPSVSLPCLRVLFAPCCRLVHARRKKFPPVGCFGGTGKLAAGGR